MDNARDFLGADRPFPGRILAQKNLIQGKELDHSIEIIHNDSFAIDGSMINQSILVATRYKPAFRWAGNVVALRREGLGQNPSELGNMSMEDFRHAVDFFSTFTSGVREGRGRASFTISKNSSKAMPYSGKYKVFTLVHKGETKKILLQ
jgi:hypothetical protein